jgi:Rieske Fe-S protein
VVIGSQLWWLLKLFFTSSQEAPGHGLMTVGAVAQFPVGHVTERRKERFVLVHHSTGFVALILECTHQKCPIHYLPDRGVVFCACHGSQFSTTGEVLVGPATRPLDRFPTAIQHEQVVVDTSRVLRGRT